MRKYSLCAAMTILLLITCQNDALGYPENQDSQPEIELEYLSPLNEQDRNIDTISLNLQKVNYAGDFVSVYSGLTLTRAWGEMNRRGVYNKCDAYGIGPMGLIRLHLMSWDFPGLGGGSGVELFFDMSGAVVFWDKKFPTGGDFYDFLWLVGPKLRLLIREKIVLNIGYKWMHVSNGQWEWHDGKTDFKATAKNPSYNAKGITVTVNKYF